MSAAIRCDGCGCYAPMPEPHRMHDLPAGWANLWATTALALYGGDGSPLDGLPAQVCSPACGERVIGRVLHAHRDRLIAAQNGTPAVEVA